MGNFELQLIIFLLDSLKKEFSLFDQSVMSVGQKQNMHNLLIS